jgi:hydrogenase expression/formation protein HypD
MRWVEEFREPAPAQRLADALARATTRPWTVMEICGGQTHTIARYGIEDLLPDGLSLLHGPGCPVCVTPLAVIEAARCLALTPGVVLCSFGDMLRVPGVAGDLLDARARGADVRVVLSPLDAVRQAAASPSLHHVFFGVGFETTAPATAMAVELARRLELENFSVLASHVRVPPAMELLLAAPDCAIDGCLAAGHVCTIEGLADYPALARRFRVPIVVTGFEPLDILQGLLFCVRQLEAGQCKVENQYTRCVQPEGNPQARAMVEQVFEVADLPWRGLGVVPAGGLRVREAWARFDARRRFDLDLSPVREPEACRAALVLTGRIVPTACPEFGRGCTPDRPLGAPMVSTEGACAAYHRYRRDAATAGSLGT